MPMRRPGLVLLLFLLAVCAAGPLRAQECPGQGVLAASDRCDKLAMKGPAIMDAYVVNEFSLVPGERTNFLLLRIDDDRAFTDLLGQQVRCPVIQGQATGDKYGRRVKAAPFYMECYTLQGRKTQRLFLKGSISDPQDKLDGIHNMAVATTPGQSVMTVLRNYKVYLQITQVLREMPCRNCDADGNPKPRGKASTPAIPSLNSTLPPEGSSLPFTSAQ